MNAVSMLIYSVLGVICFICGLYSENLYFDIGFFGFMILSAIEKVMCKLEEIKK